MKTLLMTTMITACSSFDWLALTRDASPCHSSALSSSQRRLCANKNSRFASALQRAATLTIASCTEDMGGEKWGCRGIEQLPVRSRTLAKSTQEAAYLDQLSSAHLIASIYHLCQSGTVGPCATDDIMSFVNQFTGIGIRHHKTRRLVKEVSVHNAQQGRKLAWDERRQLCRCHGTSGSCTNKTCWTTAPDGRQLGQAAAAKYQSALRLDLAAEILPREIVKLVASDRLIYLSKGEDICLSTRGRTCQTVDFTQNSHCSKLCCGRGAIRKEEMKVEQECAFIWPDSIKCVPVAQRSVRYVCQ